MFIRIFFYYSETSGFKVGFCGERLNSGRVWARNMLRDGVCLLAVADLSRNIIRLSGNYTAE